MRILIDENLSVRCRHWFSDGVAQTVEYCGWKGIDNGHLLKLAKDRGFDVFLTADRAVKIDVPRETLKQFAIIIVPTNRWRILGPMAQSVQAAVQDAQIGTITELPLLRT